MWQGTIRWEAAACMASVARALGDHARLFVAVDAPRLQATLLETFPGVAYATAGVGVDPTNEFRSGRVQYAGQLLGGQDLAERNLLKVRCAACGGRGRGDGP